MMKRPLWLGILIASAALAWAADRSVMVLQFPPDQKVALELFGTGAAKMTGSAEVRRQFKKANERVTKVEINIHDVPSPSSIKPEFSTYVAWAVNEKGAFTKLGAFFKDLKTETPLIAFGIVVSAEPNAEVATPSGVFVLESLFPAKKNSFYGMTKVVYSKQQ